MARPRHLISTFLSTAAFAGGASTAAVAETRSFVISSFYQAAYSYEGDCPEGQNPLPEDMFRFELKGIGMPEAQIDEYLADLRGGSTRGATRIALVSRGRIDGKPVNAYTYPTAVPDVGFHEVKGKYAFGFNLDGKGAASPNGFEDPETHEQGVNNQYWRAMGCNHNHRGSPKEIPAKWGLVWDNERDKMPAWLITITAADFTRDGPVTINFQKALERVPRDATGMPRADTTFRVDPDPRWRNHPLRGEIRNGMISLTEPGDVHLSSDPYIFTDIAMTRTHLRVKLNPNGSLEGVLGGYMPWRTIYFMYGGSGWNEESMLGTDIPGTYYALKHHADGDPDPKTGEMRAISTAYRVVAVPAFAAPIESGDKVSERAPGVAPSTAPSSRLSR